MLNMSEPNNFIKDFLSTKDIRTANKLTKRSRSYNKSMNKEVTETKSLIIPSQPTKKAKCIIKVNSLRNLIRFICTFSVLLY